MTSSPFKPTVIGAKRQANEPTRIGGLTSHRQPEVSALPGGVRKPLGMSADELRRRFPRESAEALAEVQACLAAFPYGSAEAGEWTAYGEGIQREVSELISRRVAANDQEVLRTAPRHLARLLELLREMSESLSAGGLLRPANPRRTWESIRPEAERLVKELDLGLPKIAAIQADTMARMAEARRLKRRILAAGRAAEVLAERLPAQDADLLAGRQASLLASEALVDELQVQFELDELRRAALIEQVRDGVLVRLPGLVNCLAGLPPKASDTERFLLKEKLAELIRLFERKR